MITLILAIILKVLSLGIVPSVEPTIIPPMPSVDPSNMLILEDEDAEWFEFEQDAYIEYLDIFDAMYENVEYKASKNGRSMTKGTYSRSFKFI
jgi:hypothetical protein